MGVGLVYASDWSGNFAVIGGDKGMIILIDMETKQVITKGIKTAIKCLYSLKFCRISQNELHLAVGGYQKDYSNSKTDLFDVSNFLNLVGNKRGNPEITKKQLIKKMNSMVKQIQKLKKNLQNHKNQIIKEENPLKETIEQLKETIEQLTEILQRQKNPNKIKQQPRKSKKCILQEPHNRLRA